MGGVLKNHNQNQSASARAPRIVLACWSTPRISGPYQHWQFLHRTFDFPVYGSMEYLRVLQHASTILGALALALWFWLWFLRTPPIEPRTGPKPAKAPSLRACLDLGRGSERSGSPGIRITSTWKPVLRHWKKGNFLLALSSRRWTSSGWEWWLTASSAPERETNCATHNPRKSRSTIHGSRSTAYEPRFTAL